MTDDQRPDNIERSAEGDAKSMPSRWPLGGLSGRFRRQQAGQSPPDDFAPDEDISSTAIDEGVIPTPAARPDASHDARKDEAAEGRTDPAEVMSEESPGGADPLMPATPHPELHPALRRDASHGANAQPGSDERGVTGEPDEDVEAATREDEGERPATAPARSTPVAEERIAFTPRPRAPTPLTPPTPSTSPDVEAEELGAHHGAAPFPPPPGAEDVPVDQEEGVEADTVPAISRRLTGVSAHLAVLTGIAMAVILAFLLIEPTPRWFLIVGAGAVILGLDGTLRETWREPFAFGQETAPFLFVPALFMLSVPVLIEHNFHGEFVVLIGIGAGLAFGSLAWAELASVRSFGIEYPQARILVTTNTYLVGFAIFSLTYVFDIGLVPSLFAAGIATAMLAIEILREGEIDPVETLGLSLVAGVVIAEARWLFYYMPLDTYLAGLALLLVFYLVTGLLHSYVLRVLNSGVALQYGGITAAGMSLVAMARMTGLA